MQFVLKFQCCICGVCFQYFNFSFLLPSEINISYSAFYNDCSTCYELTVPEKYKDVYYNHSAKEMDSAEKSVHGYVDITPYYLTLNLL